MGLSRSAPGPTLHWPCSTHNWGTESDPEFKGYSNGNADPGRGYGGCWALLPCGLGPSRLPHTS